MHNVIAIIFLWQSKVEVGRAWFLWAWVAFGLHNSGLVFSGLEDITK
jgi:hypothetical protein